MKGVKIFVRGLSSLARFEDSVQIRTCTKTYATQRDKYIFKQCPPEGIDVNVKFVDTGISQKQPTVLALHGAPGTFGDFSSMANFLTNRGIRFIAPNFPNLDYTDRTGKSSHRARLQVVMGLINTFQVTSGIRPMRSSS